MERSLVPAVILCCLLVGCSTADYTVSGDVVTITWCRDGFLVMFPATHELTLPARNGRIEADDVEYVKMGIGSRTPRAIRGYVDLDLPQRRLLVKLRFPSDREKGWAESLDMFELDEWFHEPVLFEDFSGNGRYRLVPKVVQ
jgi:hypothetical protein